MKAEKLFTIIGVLIAFCVTESFGAASIRSMSGGTSVGTQKIGASSRAGSLRSELVMTPSASVSGNVSVSSSDTAGGTRMAILPGGAPKISNKPKLPSAGYASVDLSDIESRLDDLEVGKADKSELGDFVTVGDLDGKADRSELDGLATKTELNAKADASALNNLATKTELNAKADASALNNLATKTELNAKANSVDVYDKGTVDAKISAAASGFDEGRVTQLVNTAVTNNIATTLNSYSTTAEMNTAIATATNDLVTQSQLDAKADKTELNAKANSADVYTKTEVDTKLDAKANTSALNNLATKTELNSKLDKPSGGTAGQVLARTSNGGTEWVNPASAPNVQFTTFDDEPGKLFYCGLPSGETCDPSVKTNWVAADLAALKGKDACQSFRIERDNTYTGTDGIKFDMYCDD